MHLSVVLLSGLNGGGGSPGKKSAWAVFGIRAAERRFVVSFTDAVANLAIFRDEV